MIILWTTTPGQASSRDTSAKLNSLYHKSLQASEVDNVLNTVHFDTYVASPFINDFFF